MNEKKLDSLNELLAKLSEKADDSNSHSDLNDILDELGFSVESEGHVEPNHNIEVSI